MPISTSHIQGWDHSLPIAPDKSKYAKVLPCSDGTPTDNLHGIVTPPWMSCSCSLDIVENVGGAERRETEILRRKQYDGDRFPPAASCPQGRVFQGSGDVSSQGASWSRNGNPK